MKTNEGLKSRFPSVNFIDIKDYSKEELNQIMDLNIKNWHYDVDQAAAVKLTDHIMKLKIGTNFANARYIENAWYAIREAQALRSDDIDDLTIIEDDVEVFIKKDTKDEKTKNKMGFLSQQEL